MFFLVISQTSIVTGILGTFLVKILCYITNYSEETIKKASEDFFFPPNTVCECKLIWCTLRV